MKKLILFSFSFLLVSAISSQMDSVNLQRKTHFTFDANYSSNFAGLAKNDPLPTSYEATTLKSGQINSFQVSTGIVYRKFIGGVSFRHQRVHNDINYHAYHPYIPLLSINFDVFYTANNLGFYLGRNFYLNSNSYFKLKGQLSYCFFNDLESGTTERELYRPQLNDTTTMTYYSYVTPFDHLQSEISGTIFTQTNIGAFGIGVNFLVIPYATANARVEEGIFTRGFSNVFLPRGYVGFNFSYEWSKARK